MAAEVLQKLDLSKRSLREDLLTEDICDLLDRNALLRLVVRSSTVQAIISMGRTEQQMRSNVSASGQAHDRV